MRASRDSSGGSSGSGDIIPAAWGELTTDLARPWIMGGARVWGRMLCAW